METKGGGATRRPADAIPRLAAVALVCAIAACGPSEPAQPVSPQSASPQPTSGQSISAVPLSSLTLDIDGDGEVTSHADAMLILRYTSGFRGEELIEGAVAPGCKRCTADEIGKYIDSL